MWVKYFMHLMQTIQHPVAILASRIASHYTLLAIALYITTHIGYLHAWYDASYIYQLTTMCSYKANGWYSYGFHINGNV